MHDLSGCRNNALHGWIALSAQYTAIVPSMPCCKESPTTKSRELPMQQNPPKPHNIHMQAAVDTSLQTGQRGIPVSHAHARVCCANAAVFKHLLWG